MTQRSKAGVDKILRNTTPTKNRLENGHQDDKENDIAPKFVNQNSVKTTSQVGGCGTVYVKALFQYLIDKLVSLYGFFLLKAFEIGGRCGFKVGGIRNPFSVKFSKIDILSNDQPQFVKRLIGEDFFQILKIGFVNCVDRNGGSSGQLSVVNDQFFKFLQAYSSPVYSPLLFWYPSLF